MSRYRLVIRGLLAVAMLGVPLGRVPRLGLPLHGGIGRIAGLHRPLGVPLRRHLLPRHGTRRVPLRISLGRHWLLGIDALLPPLGIALWVSLGIHGLLWMDGLLRVHRVPLLRGEGVWLPIALPWHRLPLGRIARLLPLPARLLEILIVSVIHSFPALSANAIGRLRRTSQAQEDEQLNFLHIAWATRRECGRQAIRIRQCK